MKTKGIVYHRVYLKAYEEEREKESVRELYSDLRFFWNFMARRTLTIKRFALTFWHGGHIRQHSRTFGHRIRQRFLIKDVRTPQEFFSFLYRNLRHPDGIIEFPSEHGSVILEIPRVGFVVLPSVDPATRVKEVTIVESFVRNNQPSTYYLRTEHLTYSPSSVASSAYQP